MSTTLITTPAALTITAVEHHAANVSVAAGGTFAALLLTLHLTESELDPTWHFVSEYALGRTGALMTAGFVALAVALLAAVVALARPVRTVPGRIGLALLVVAAAGLLLAAAFPTDPITTPAGAGTGHGRLHELGAALDYSPVGMLLVGRALGRTRAGRPHRRALLAAAGVPVVLMLVFTGSVVSAGGEFGPGVYAGLLGRLLLLSYLGWLVVVRRALHAPAGSG